MGFFNNIDRKSAHAYIYVNSIMPYQLRGMRHSRQRETSLREGDSQKVIQSVVQLKCQQFFIRPIETAARAADFEYPNTLLLYHVARSSPACY